MYGNSVILRLNRCAAVRAGVAAAYGIDASAVFAGGLFHYDRLRLRCSLLRRSIVAVKRYFLCTLVFICVRSEEYHKECVYADEQEHKDSYSEGFAIKSELHYSRSKCVKAVGDSAIYLCSLDKQPLVQIVCKIVCYG